MSFWLRHQVGLLFFLLALLLIALSNLVSWRRLGQYTIPSLLPALSVLIPVRNEAANVSPCVRSLLAQQYPKFELLVLDDNSSDSTLELLTQLERESPRLRLLRGDPLPPGWLGKHWACHQLAQAARGELLLFVDADTRHQPTTLRDGVAALLSENADLLSAMPKQNVATWAEKLVVPLMPWSVFSFLPLGVAYRTKIPALSATVGQFMMFRRSAYTSIGGHAAVRNDVVDDLALGRRVKAAGLRWRLVDAQRHVHTRMYHSFAEVVEGFGKNLFAVFGYNVLLFSFVWSWLVVVFCEPVVVLFLALGGAVTSAASVMLAAAAIGLSLLLWGLVYWRFEFALTLVPLYPLSVLLIALVALRSMVTFLFGRTTWKGRPIAPGRLGG